MEVREKGLGIIFHSSSYDRVYHGLSIALAGLALGREAKFFFTYWALEYLRANNTAVFKLDKEAQAHKAILERNIKAGHLVKITELFQQAKAMGAKFYVCTSSMGILNIARDELTDIVNKTMGITTFLTETGDFQILFI